MFLSDLKFSDSKISKMDLSPSLDTKDWLSSIENQFCSLKNDDQLAVLLYLASKSNPHVRSRFLSIMLQSMENDFCSVLPMELIEKVFNYLCVEDLLSASRVSKKWNGIVSKLLYVWRRKWIQLGLGNSVDIEDYSERDWKLDCTKCVEFWNLFVSGQAFQFVDIIQFDYRHPNFNLDYCRNFLVVTDEASIIVMRKKENKWKKLAETDIVNGVSYISCIRLFPQGLIVIGTHRGNVILLQLGKHISYYIQMKHLCRGHTNKIYSVDADEEFGLVASASADRKLKLWSIKNGVCVMTFHSIDQIILQVSLKLGAKSPVEEYNFILCAHGDISLIYFPISTNSPDNFDWIRSGPHYVYNVLNSGFDIMAGFSYLRLVQLVDNTLYYFRANDDASKKALMSTTLDFEKIVRDPNGSVFEEKAIGPPKVDRGTYELRVGRQFALIFNRNNLQMIDLKSEKLTTAPFSEEFRDYHWRTHVESLTWFDGLIHLRNNDVLGMVVKSAYKGSIKIQELTWDRNVPVF